MRTTTIPEDIVAPQQPQITAQQQDQQVYFADLKTSDGRSMLEVMDKYRTKKIVHCPWSICQATCMLYNHTNINTNNSKTHTHTHTTTQTSTSTNTNTQTSA